tara:strand:+ start:2198 stop:2479 length:282 start_codon:yes stop_codon:yes gene_type:complete
MNKLYLIPLVSLFLISCSDYLEESILDSCIQNTPGGSSYVELCECRTDLLLDSLTSEEKDAARRDFNEIGDDVHAISFTRKSLALMEDTSCLN